MPKEIGKTNLAEKGEARTLASQLRESTTDALRYWERRRPFYNLLLLAVVAGHVLAEWPAARSALTLETILGLFILAVLANVAYSAVYPADLFIQLSGFRESRRTWRRVLLIVGFAFAGVLAHFASQGTVGGHPGG